MTDQFLPVSAVAETLREKHYLGPARKGFAYRDEFGVIVLSAPTSRRLPLDWLELTRWCITSAEKNAGSKQWGRLRKMLAGRATTVVSYSNPGVGHTGALYRACNWWWAPTWHRLRPPPTGNGAWGDPGAVHHVKDRWVFALASDPRRVELLVAKDEGVLRKMPWARFVEGKGADFKRFSA